MSTSIAGDSHRLAKEGSERSARRCRDTLRCRRHDIGPVEEHAAKMVVTTEDAHEKPGFATADVDDHAMPAEVVEAGQLGKCVGG